MDNRAIVFMNEIEKHIDGIEKEAGHNSIKKSFEDMEKEIIPESLKNKVKQ